MINLFTLKRTIDDDVFRIVFLDTDQYWSVLVQLEHGAQTKSEVSSGLHHINERPFAAEWRHRLVGHLETLAAWRADLESKTNEQGWTKEEELLFGLNIGFKWLMAFPTKHFDYPGGWINMDEELF